MDTAKHCHLQLQKMYHQLSVQHTHTLFTTGRCWAHNKASVNSGDNQGVQRVIECQHVPGSIFDHTKNICSASCNSPNKKVLIQSYGWEFKEDTCNVGVSNNWTGTQGTQGGGCLGSNLLSQEALGQYSPKQSSPFLNPLEPADLESITLTRLIVGEPLQATCSPSVACFTKRLWEWNGRAPMQALQTFQIEARKQIVMFHLKLCEASWNKIDNYGWHWGISSSFSPFPFSLLPRFVYWDKLKIVIL